MGEYRLNSNVVYFRNCHVIWRQKCRRLLREEFLRLKSRLLSLWTTFYFSCTVGIPPIVVIKQYIENQKIV